MAVIVLHGRGLVDAAFALDRASTIVVRCAAQNVS